MRLSAQLELLCRGRVLRVCLSRRWQVGALSLCGTWWLALGPLRLLVHARRVMWED